MYKLLALDLDGTLLGKENQISQRVKRNIKELKNKGIKVVLASGREPTSVSKFAKELELNEYIIALNGAIVTDVDVKEIMFRKDIAAEISKDVIHISEENGIQNVLFIEDRIYSSKKSDYLDLFCEYAHEPVNIVGKLSDFYSNQKVGKIILVDEHDILKKAKDKIEEKFHRKVNVDFSKPFFLEIYNFKTSKGTMLSKIADSYGINREEIIAIGDGENDISMIEYAGLGVAMGNALDAVKERADFVTYTNLEDGVNYVIEKYL